MNQKPQIPDNFFIILDSRNPIDLMITRWAIKKYDIKEPIDSFINTLFVIHYNDAVMAKILNGAYKKIPKLTGDEIFDGFFISTYSINEHTCFSPSHFYKLLNHEIEEKKDNAPEPDKQEYKISIETFGTYSKLCIWLKIEDEWIEAGVTNPFETDLIISGLNIELSAIKSSTNTEKNNIESMKATTQRSPAISFYAKEVQTPAKHKFYIDDWVYDLETGDLVQISHRLSPESSHLKPEPHYLIKEYLLKGRKEALPESQFSKKLYAC